MGYLAITIWSTVAGLVVFSILFAYFLPSEYDHDQDTKDEEKARADRGTIKADRRVRPVTVQILVLGDIGRSPRMQYHARSIAKNGGIVHLIGYHGSFIFPCLSLFCPSIRLPFLRVARISATPGSCGKPSRDALPSGSSPGSTTINPVYSVWSSQGPLASRHTAPRPLLQNACFQILVSPGELHVDLRPVPYPSFHCCLYHIFPTSSIKPS